MSRTHRDEAPVGAWRRARTCSEGGCVEVAVAPWRRARKCGEGRCVEVAPSDGNVLVRDSKDPGGANLAFTKAEWRTFIAGVKEGDFDDTLW
jgi:hypothetical protein